MDRLSLIYAAVTAAWILLRRLTGDRTWWLKCFNDLLPIALMPSAPLALCAALLGRGRALCSALVPLTWFHQLYGYRFRERSRRASGSPRLRLMTFNVLCRNRPADATIAAIREADPDVVFLQELVPSLGEPLGPTLREAYPYQAIYPALSARGTAVLSRFPILEEQRFQLSFNGWFCQEVRIDWAGRPLTLVNIHLLRPEFKLRPEVDWQPYDARLRETEMKRLIERVREQRGDVIVAGDFNMIDQSADYRAINDLLRDAYADVGFGMGFTYPARTPYAAFAYERNGAPFLRLDHVFYQGRMRPLTAIVGPHGDSDHHSVVVELEQT